MTKNIKNNVLNENVSNIVDIALGIILYKTIYAVLGLTTLAGVYSLFKGGLALYEKNYRKCIESLREFCNDVISQLQPNAIEALKSKPLKDSISCIRIALQTASNDKNSKIAKNAKTLLKFYDKHITNGNDAVIDFSNIIEDALKQK